MRGSGSACAATSAARFHSALQQAQAAMGRAPRLWALLLVLLAPRGRAWDSGDLELFDLAEEVPRNFYDFLGVQQVSAARPGPRAARGEPRVPPPPRARRHLRAHATARPRRSPRLALPSQPPFSSPASLPHTPRSTRPRRCSSRHLASSAAAALEAAGGCFAPALC